MKTSTSKFPANMQLASIISDLSTLRACDPKDALNLVTLPTSTTSPSSATRPETGTDEKHNADTDTDPDPDPDLSRAKDFLNLYASLQERDGRQLEELRRMVDAVVGRVMFGGVGGFGEE